MNYQNHCLIAVAALFAFTGCGSASRIQNSQTQPALMSQAVSPATKKAAAAYDFEMDVFHPVSAENGMVVSEQELASRVGLDILQAGGNAVDAAVAMGFALAVVLPNAGNIGGGGFMLVHDAKSQQDIALDFREIAPIRAHRDMYLNEQGQVIDGQSLYSHQAVGVPGTVAGMEHALKKWGSMSLTRVLQPAIELANKGFLVSEPLAKILQQEADNMGKWPATREIFWKGDRPLQKGEKLVQKDLGKTLGLIAQSGVHAFYEGAIAQKIAAEMVKHGGSISTQDLLNYRVRERQPIRGTYRGYEIVTMPPPSSGGIHVVQMLNMMEGWPLSSWGHNSAKTVHHVAEAMKLAYADRAEYLGDTDFVKVPVCALTAKPYAQHLTKLIKDSRALPASQVKPGQPQRYESDQTTHYSVMDKVGNAVAVTYTLNTNFGSGIVAQGTGIVLNNQMDDFSVKPGVPNTYGLIGGEANAIEAGKRPLSSMTPTFVLKNGQPWLVTGSPGGARIITTVLQMISNSIDFNLNPAQATMGLRFHNQWTPDELRLEQGFSKDTIELLQKRGHKVEVRPAMGRTQTIQRQGAKFLGYSDPRNPDGKALGY